jgi:hypothetical protein
MAESIRPRDERIARPLRRRSDRLSAETTTLIIVALSLLCWALLVALGVALWSALG